MNQRISIINLAFSLITLGILNLWKIPEKQLALSDHELILLRWKDMDISLSQNAKSKAIKWDSIKSLCGDKDKLSKVGKK